MAALSVPPLPEGRLLAGRQGEGGGQRPVQTEHVGHGRISEPAGAGRGRGFGRARPRRGWRWMVLRTRGS